MLKINGRMINSVELRLMLKMLEKFPDRYSSSERLRKITAQILRAGQRANTNIDVTHDDIKMARIG